jgi:hypothetical protein
MSITEFEIWVKERDTGGDFDVEVVDAPGTVNSPTMLPLSPTGFRISTDVLRSASPPDLTRAAESNDPVLRFPLSPSGQREEEFGAALFDQLIGKNTALYATWAIFTGQERRRLRLCLTEKTGVWPWETLYNRKGEFIARRNISIVRYVKMRPRMEPLHFGSKEPLRMLVVFGEDLSQSAAGETEEQAIQSALSDSLRRDIEIKFIKPEQAKETTLEQIRQTVRDQQYHILHYFGHGSSSRQGLLRLASGHPGTADPYWVKGRDLIDALEPTLPSLRLVILNACELAQATQEAISGNLPYTNLPTAFLQAGSAMVIAMQYPIRKETASKFTKAFYEYLSPRLFGQAFEIEEAVVNARRAIAISASNIEWVTPVVFTRMEDEVIFDMPQERLEKYKETREIQEINKLLQGIKEDYEAGKWLEAVEKLAQLLKNYPATVEKGNTWKDKLLDKSTELISDMDLRGQQLRTAIENSNS